MTEQSRTFSRQENRKILEELESLVFFDQSQSSQWPRVTIFVEAGGTDPYQDDSFQIYPNGRPYNVQKSADAPVPPEVVDAIRLCMTSILVKDKDAPTGYSQRPALRFPFRIVDTQSQRRHDAWKSALEVLRVVITKTERTVQADGKVLHKILDRYLPDEHLDEAVAAIDFAKKESAQEEKKAAELRQAAA